MRRRVGVVGAAGRMGGAVCAAVARADGLELVAAVDTKSAGATLESVGGPPGTGLVISPSREELVGRGCEVAVDFTVASSAVETLEFCAGAGVHVVCGTTGIEPATLDRLAALFAPADRPNAVVAPNFAISAVLMMRFAEIAAPLLDGVEVIELHHSDKRDAPSGTALETVRRIAEARRRAGAGPFAADPTEIVALASARGASGPGDVHVHSVRLPGLLAHQEVIFGALGQVLTIRQDSFDRTSFMPGVLLAIAKVATLGGMTTGLDEVLGI